MCGDNIGDYAYVDEYWYCCPQNTGWLHIKVNLDGIIHREHKIQGRGWGRLGYTLCERCATKSGFKCPICGATLIKVHADQHPGGKWGIRGKQEILLTDHYIDKASPKREPAPMW